MQTATLKTATLKTYCVPAKLPLQHLYYMMSLK